MRILIIATWFPTASQPTSGIFIAQQAKALATDHNVSVVTVGSSVDTNLPHAALDGDAPYTIFRERVNAGRGFLRRYCQAVSRVAKETQPDIIHAHVTNPGGVAAVVAGWMTKTPVVITEHFGPFSACMRTLRDRVKIKFALRNANAVIAVSDALRCAIQSYGIRRPIDVVPNVVDTAVFHCEPTRAVDSESRRVLFVGRLGDEQKNLPSLLRAAALLRQHADYRLTVIGDGMYQPRYSDLAESLGLSGVCTFILHVSPAELNRQFHQHDVLVLPSLGETFGCVLAEAISAGCPVVSTDCGGPRDIVTAETGRLVPVNDDLALAEAIHEVCSHRDRFKPEALTAYADQRFGPNAVVKQLRAIYNRILN